MKDEQRKLKLQSIEWIRFDVNEELCTLLDKAEREVLAIAMRRCRNNQLVCAKELGISRGTLRTKLNKYFGSIYFSQLLRKLETF